CCAPAAWSRSAAGGCLPASAITWSIRSAASPIRPSPRCANGCCGRPPPPPAAEPSGYHRAMVQPEAIAQVVRDAFDDYHARFAAISRRARQRFEQRDWAGARADAAERLDLYDLCIDECRHRLAAMLGLHAHDRALWAQVRDHYAASIDGAIDTELYKTFFNTLTRRFFRTRGVDADVEFVALDIEPTDAITRPVARHSYAVSTTRPVDAFVRMLGDYRFDVPYAHLARCAAAIAVRLQDDLAHWGEHPVRAIE